MTAKYRVKLSGGRGLIIATNVTLSKNCTSWLISMGECTCHKNTCDCTYDLILPAKSVYDVEYKNGDTIKSIYDDIVTEGMERVHQLRHDKNMRVACMKENRKEGKRIRRLTCDMR